MIDKNALKEYCKDFMCLFINADSVDTKRTLPSKVRDFLHSTGVSDRLDSQNAREFMEAVIYDELDKESRRWLRENLSSQELIAWMEGFIIGVNLVIPYLPEMTALAEEGSLAEFGTCPQVQPLARGRQ